MSFLQTPFKCLLMLIAVMSIVLPGFVSAAQLFSDDVAVELDGELRSVFTHVLEPDGDKTVRPGTVNRADTRLRLAPGLWVNEFVSIETMFDVDARWGSGTGPLDFDGRTGPVNLTVGRAALNWQTPIGKLTIGRAGWHWGLGVFDHDGRTDLDRYGVPTGTGAQDMLRLRTAPFGIDNPFYLTAFVRSWFNGTEGNTGFVDNGWSYGAAVEGDPELLDYGALLRFDRHRAPDTNVLWVDAYNRWQFWVMTVEYEAAFRWGRSGYKNATNPDDGIFLLYEQGQRLERRPTEWLSGAGVFRVMFDRAKAGPIEFRATGIEAGMFSGDSMVESLTQEGWGLISANRDYKVGLLLLPTIWPARQAAFGQLLVSAQDRVGLNSAGEYLQQTYDARVGQGMGNVWYLYPGFGLKTDDDLRFRLNFLYARSFFPLQTLEVADDRGTVQTFDDRYREEHSYGFEIDVHLSYPLWGTVTGVLESGVAFPGAGFTGADSKGQGVAPPISFILMPRLTVGF